MAPEDVAFSSVTQLAPQVRSRKVSPVELTQLYLNRIKRLDPQLLAVITLTEEGWSLTLGSMPIRALSSRRRRCRKRVGKSWCAPARGKEMGKSGASGGAK